MENKKNFDKLAYGSILERWGSEENTQDDESTAIADVLPVEEPIDLFAEKKEMDWKKYGAWRKTLNIKQI